MDLIDALVLGVVEGVTEFLPVSSTGHLLVAQRALGLGDDEVAHAYAICIQLGAILAVTLLYGRRIRQVVSGVAGRDPAGRRLAVALTVAFLPAAVVGLTFQAPIEEQLFGVWPIIAAWITGGLGILLWERSRPVLPSRAGQPLRALEDVGWRTALFIGVFQCLALWPGTSRSLVTILGAALAGLALPAAIEFSFLLGALTLTAATVYKGVELGPEMLAAYGAGPLLLGGAAAAVSAALAVRWMVAWLSRHGLSLFAWWRIAAGVLTALAVLAGWI